MTDTPAPFPTGQPVAEPPAPPRAGWAYAMLVLVMALWAGNSIVGRAVRDHVPPLTLALMRWSGALLVLAPFAFRHVRREWRAILAAWRPVLLLAFLGVACFNAFLYSGLRQTTAANALLMQAGVPGLVLLIDAVLFRVRPSRLSLAGVLASTAGVAVIVLHGDATMLGQTGLNPGDLLVLAGVVCWALYTSLLRLRPALHPMSFLWATFAVGVIAMTPLAVLEWAMGARIAWTAQSAMGVAYVAVFPSVVAYGLFNAAVTRLGAGAVGQTLNLMPVIGAVLAATLLAEPLHGYHFVGMALVALGIGAPAVERAWRARPGAHR